MTGLAVGTWVRLNEAFKALPQMREHVAKSSARRSLIQLLTKRRRWTCAGSRQACGTPTRQSTWR
jgi:hypothetical protein